MYENVVYFKLATGDDIISYVDEELASEDSDIVMLFKPLKIHTYNTPQGAAVRLAKWIPFIEEKHIALGVDQIVIRSTPSDDILEFYHDALDTIDDLSLEDIEQNDEEEELTQALYERFSNTSIMVH